MKVIIFSLLVILAMSNYQAPSHNYWTSKLRDTVKVTDIAWGYCDYKCTYLENYYPNNDFFVIRFSASAITTPDFTACYVKTSPTATPALWSTVAGSNAYYEANCGGDKEDYLALTTGASPKYSVANKEGEGLAVEITPY